MAFEKVASYQNYSQQHTAKEFFCMINRFSQKSPETDAHARKTQQVENNQTKKASSKDRGGSPGLGPASQSVGDLALYLVDGGETRFYCDPFTDCRLKAIYRCLSIPRKTYHCKKIGTTGSETGI